jgi:hypothetical protein
LVAVAVLAAGKGELGQARLSAHQNLASQLAARGFGPGSGYMAEQEGDIESNYLKSLGALHLGLTKFAQTPLTWKWWQKQPELSGAQVFSGETQDLLEQALGFYMMSNVLKGGKG